MIYLYLLASCVAFIELFIALDIRRDTMSVLTRSRDAMQVVLSPDLDDDEKEAFMRRASVEMFKSLSMFLVKFLAIVAVLSVIYTATVYAFPHLRGPILDSFVSPVVLIGLTALASIYVWVRNAVFR